MNFPRSFIEAQAARVSAALQGLHRSLAPTGALRRGDPTSSSIDYICLSENPDAVAERCLRQTYLAKRNEQMLSVTMQNGLGLNLWFARMAGGDLFTRTPGNLEVLQVIHTPTRLYLRDFVQHIRKAGFSLSHDKGLLSMDKRQIATTEAGIYGALNLELPDPSNQLEFRPTEASTVRIAAVISSDE